jgi:small subunit ribosomal protein S16
VAVKIKLKRVGKIHAPQYRVVVADSRTARNGRAIEEIGIYQPLDDPSIIKVDSERVQYWLGVGAQPTEAVAAILKVTGDWQKFKGEPGAEGTLKVAEPKPDKKIAYETAVKEAASEPKTPAPKKVEKVEEVAEAVVDKAEEVVEAVAEKVEEVVEAVAEKVEEVAEAVADKVEEVVEAVTHSDAEKAE